MYQQSVIKARYAPLPQAPGLGKQAKDQSALPGVKLNVRAYSQGSNNKTKTPLFEQDVVTQGGAILEYWLLIKRRDEAYR